MRRIFEEALEDSDNYADLCGAMRSQEGMSVYDPMVGSGGMLIQIRDYRREKGGSGEMALYGQEKMVAALLC